jgi:hypothetical protein
MELVDLTQRMSDNQKEALADMLEDLESIRKRIESGEVKGFAYSICYTDGAVSNGWSGYNCRTDLSSSIALLNTRYQNACLES